MARTKLKFPRRLRPRKPRRPERVSAAEQARRTRFITGQPPAPAADPIETLVRERTNERLSGAVLAEALQGKPEGYFHEVGVLDLYIAKAILRTLLPLAKNGVGGGDPEDRDRALAWIVRAEEFIA